MRHIKRHIQRLIKANQVLGLFWFFCAPAFLVFHLVFLSFSLEAQDAVSPVSRSPVPMQVATAPAEPIRELTSAQTPWNGFKVGSLIQTRTTTQTFQDKGGISIAESTISLEAIEKDGLVLKQTDSVEMGGKKVQGEPQIKKIDFYQQPITGTSGGQPQPPETISIGGHLVRCGVRVYEQITPQARRKTKVWYNPDIAPYVLCTEITKTSVATAEQPTEKLLGRSVTIVSRPPAKTLRGALFGSYRIQTTKQNIDGTSITLSNCSLRVPGGIESEKTWEYNRENSLIRIHTTSYTRYAYQQTQPQTSEVKVVEVDAATQEKPRRR